MLRRFFGMQEDCTIRLILKRKPVAENKFFGLTKAWLCKHISMVKAQGKARLTRKGITQGVHPGITHAVFFGRRIKADEMPSRVRSHIPAEDSGHRLGILISFLLAPSSPTHQAPTSVNMFLKRRKSLALLHHSRATTLHEIAEQEKKIEKVLPMNWYLKWR